MLLISFVIIIYVFFFHDSYSFFQSVLVSRDFSITSSRVNVPDAQSLHIKGKA
jgi:hypothetical protein